MDNLQELHIVLDHKLKTFAELFKPGIKLTLIARAPNAGLVITDDDLEEVIAEIRRRQTPKGNSNLPKNMVPYDPEEHPDLIKWNEFITDCYEGHLMDDDGFAKLATETHVSKRTVFPSMIVRGTFRKPAWVTHVVWYNT